jgi:hypothetical protein
VRIWKGVNRTKIVWRGSLESSVVSPARLRCSEQWYGTGSEESKECDVDSGKILGRW